MQFSAYLKIRNKDHDSYLCRYRNFLPTKRSRQSILTKLWIITDRKSPYFKAFVDSGNGIHNVIVQLIPVPHFYCHPRGLSAFVPKHPDGRRSTVVVRWISRHFRCHTTRTLFSLESRTVPKPGALHLTDWRTEEVANSHTIRLSTSFDTYNRV